MIGITDLSEELIAMIAHRLNRNDCVHLADICRYLNMSTSLIAHVWKVVSLPSDFPFLDSLNRRVNRPSNKPIVADSRLKQNAVLIHTLSFYGPLRPEYYRIAFPCLTLHSVRFIQYYASLEDKGVQFDGVIEAELRISCTRLLRLNSTIKELSISTAFFQLTRDFWKAVFTTL
ncbi:hypothetical protein BGW39_001624 [Mortierella sp. 14UC]|nr:hypothetical protein BGW39_001624 [Mortierella sp. 14UC]